MAASRYRRVADILRERIEHGLYEPGNSLPSEAALSSEFRVSRDCVRNALDVLLQEGLITKRQGHKARVRPDVQRSVVNLWSGDRLIVRAPSRSEYETFELAAGVALLQLTRANGAVELLPSDEVEISGESTCGCR